MAKEKASGLYLCTVGFGAAGNGDDYNSTRRQCEPSYLRCPASTACGVVTCTCAYRAVPYFANANDLS